MESPDIYILYFLKNSKYLEKFNPLITPPLAYTNRADSVIRKILLGKYGKNERIKIKKYSKRHQVNTVYRITRLPKKKKNHKKNVYEKKTSVFDIRYTLRARKTETFQPGIYDIGNNNPYLFIEHVFLFFFNINMHCISGRCTEPRIGGTRF